MQKGKIYRRVKSYSPLGELIKMGHNWKPALLCLVLGLFCASTTATTNSTSPGAGQSSPAAGTSTAGKTQETTVITTTMKTSTVPVDQECAAFNNSCNDCVNNAKCMYCYSDDSCLEYPVGEVLPTSKCALSEARWGVCWLNFEALIISVSVIGGSIILTITFCCIYCCCCRGKSKKRYAKEDAKYEQQKMERKVKQDERKVERKGRLDEIRRKYGLMKDDAPCQRFDA